MATRIYGVNPGEQYPDVREAVGPTATSAIVALVVDLDTTLITEGSVTRGPTLEEVFKAIEELKAYLLNDNSWPPA